MKIRKILVASIFMIALLMGAVAFAADKKTETKESYRLDEVASRVGFNKSAQYSSVYGVVNLTVNLLLSLLAIIFLGMMLYAGLRWITSQGEEEKIGKARTAIKAAIIGLALVVGSYGISSFLFKSMGYAGSSTAKVSCTDAKAKDGDSCGDNSVCFQKSCVSECKYKYKNLGVCTSVNGCKASYQTEGMCPGDATNVCCHKYK